MDAGDFIDLYAVKRYWKVQKAGNVDLHFDAAPTNEAGRQGEEMVPLPAAVDDYNAYNYYLGVTTLMHYIPYQYVGAADSYPNK